MWEQLGTQFPHLFWSGKAVPTLYSLPMWELRSHSVPTLVVPIFNKLAIAMCFVNTEKCLKKMSNVTKESIFITFLNALVFCFTYYVLMLISDVHSHFVF